MSKEFAKTPGGAILMDGTVVAKTVQSKIAKTLAQSPDAKITLATVLIGADPASKLYVGMKQRRAAEVGMHSKHVELAGDISMQQACEEINQLVEDPAIHGILIQLPLPKHLDTHAIIDLLPAEKDVDGLSKNNLGNLLRGQEGLAPCTPSGVMRILEHYQIETSGKRAVVIGRSTLVGLPQVLLLSKKGIDATVTLVHSRSGDVGEFTKSADIVVAAAGIAHLVKAEHIKPGACVIDVGVTRTEDGIKGDVDYAAVQAIAGAITPMPGGTGPMTVACLLENTLHAARLQKTV